MSEKDLKNKKSDVAVDEDKDFPFFVTTAGLAVAGSALTVFLD